MFSHQQIAEYEQQFRDMAAQGNCEAMKKLLGEVPALNINARDPETGRTAFHLAAFNKHPAAFKFIFDNGGNRKQIDFCGFTPEETWLNPYEFHPALLLDQFSEQLSYYHFIIDEMNAKLPSSMRLVYIYRIEEIESYIADHPELSHIGFVVQKPNCLRQVRSEGRNVYRDFHISPIIYLKKDDEKAIFVQLDSVEGHCYPIAAATKSLQRKMYYFPYYRQATMEGCFEDAINILFRLLQAKNFDLAKFCETNSICDKEILLPLNAAERNVRNGLQDKLRKNNIASTEVIRYTELNRRHSKSILDKYYKSISTSAINEIYQLQTLPSFLLKYIDVYYTIRELRTKHPEIFLQEIELSDGKKTTVLDDMLSQGQKRFPKTTNAAIKKNLDSSDVNFDFSGPSFSLRAQRYAKHYHFKSRFILRFFAPTVEDRPAARICEYVTGFQAPLKP